MILVADVGNSNIALGVYRKHELIYHWRIATSRQKSEDEYAMTIKALFGDKALPFESIEGIIISSVVPPIMYTLEQMCKRYFKLNPMIIGPGIKTGLNIKYDNPREVGADRIVNAVAAIELYGSPLVIVDFGTATTYCYINEQKQYMGGAIAPGISISTEALYTKASKLPRIEIAKPVDVLGKNTVHAMQAGIFFGYVGQVDGIVGRMKEQSKEIPAVIATGGLASLISTEARSIDVVDPLLTLKGLRIIYEKNKEQHKNNF
ncbi:type III pantothenate kinase [Alkalihalophilus marmarensis]|jgi:type III pantothenate kinase|uniref:Type III pantothenate kinase n=1 Tax=Alkalihalophilus marmarensis DSM 21297 TaxID=1188261 RepID=U6SPL0_9BACI|nr:type III pantothenate kinase [Alkalihalophilus marmarensis]ERN53548.1 pantothenate kinase [Alkalihalophilus marmarensis DSM 21297]MCM3491478.1 type III pantothenate kinase [Alkalihalophilus marmarensis]